MTLVDPCVLGAETMNEVFIVCAAVGGTVLVIQFLMGLIGLGGHMFDVDVPQDVGHDFGGDFHGDAGGDFHGDHAGGGDGHAADGADQAGHHGSMHLLRILSFRAIVAALAFFGLGGLAAQSSGADMPTVLVIAAGAGVAAMVAVYWMMRGLQELRADGTVRLQRALGQHGNVYLRVPANRSGSGKIQFNLQNRTMEYLAVTAGPELATGTKVVVVGVVNPTTLEVQAES
jgi:hypothetical protein